MSSAAVVGCLGLYDPMRQYFSLYQAVAAIVIGALRVKIKLGTTFLISLIQ